MTNIVDIAVAVAVKCSVTVFFDGEDECDEENYVHSLQLAAANVLTFKERQTIVKVTNYAEGIVKAMTDTTFKSHFRLTRATMSSLLQRLGPLITSEYGINYTFSENYFSLRHFMLSVEQIGGVL
jgi:hypothetical protein